MTDEEKLLKLAEMDGYTNISFRLHKFYASSIPQLIGRPKGAEYDYPIPTYLSDFSSIISLIQKQDKATLTKLVLAMKGQNDVSRMVDWLKLSPRELCDLLLKVKGIS